MINQFRNFIDNNQICLKTDRILVGVSGGIDSICLADLFIKLNYHIGIAHCNFQLRGEESDQDELFVRSFATENDLPFFNTRFETSTIAESEHISIQMAARDLRYEWFEEVRSKHGYKYIAIAHNKNDVIETFLINLTRGSGIKGFTGIKPISGNIIRPLLFASRNEIYNYISSNNIEYREDSSNRSVKYSRNLIRHEIIPLFEKINPRFQDTILENISKLKETEQIYNQQIESIKEKLLIFENNRVLIKIDELNKLDPKTTYFYELIQPFGFTKSQIKDIIDVLKAPPGKQFKSLTHRLVKDREYIMIEEISVIKNTKYIIDSNISQLQYPVLLELSNFEKTNDFEIIKDNNIGLFDMDKIEFPLTLRKWEKGDYFMPLGMKNLKKLSDFFIDSKISIIDKENTWILESNGKIMWVIGQRIDERFKIIESTKYILKIKSTYY